MKQATQPGFYSNPDGTDVHIPLGAVRPDGHPDVQRLPAIFRHIQEEDPPQEKAKAAAPRKPASGS